MRTAVENDEARDGPTSRAPLEALFAVGVALGGVRVTVSVASEFGATIPRIGCTASRPPPLPRPLAEATDVASSAYVTAKSVVVGRGLVVGPTRPGGARGGGVLLTLGAQR